MSKEKRVPPQEAARNHARKTALSGRGGAELCPYRSKSWQTVWLREFEKMKQINLFPGMTVQNSGDDQ
ncbi:hypothetical protein [Sansalvadorimonas verongulae]|uniref:hypothetical protein n=1 Tax=Sansalvadorimonas verongulae TaxID=2172824 RepID=UPI0012BD2C27|nr:hypothetical protein [Sansalvadorimonas verongulae]MTI12136.1 hypothetical protein [Sansalvadorimonas verongulae]